MREIAVNVAAEAPRGLRLERCRDTVRKFTVNVAADSQPATSCVTCCRVHADDGDGHREYGSSAAKYSIAVCPLPETERAVAPGDCLHYATRNEVGMDEVERPMT